MSTLAYSYIRFSTPDQIKGDSLRRQTKAAQDWCQRHEAHLDTSLTLHDLGRSAFTGKHRVNPDRNALAAFLKAVEQGKVPRGSYLILEALDRLTREHVKAGLSLILSLLESGIRIVQLSPSEMIYDENADEMQLFIAIVELSRGHRESLMKSKRNKATWDHKIESARNGNKQPPRRRDGRVTKAITGRLPGWIEERDGKLLLIPERAAVVRRLFQMVAQGYGLQTIVKTFTQEGIKPFRDSKHWTRSTMLWILRQRHAVGEFQPKTKGRKPVGAPIADYYPPVVSEEEWLAAKAGLEERFIKRGRTSRYVNIFSGLLTNAADGSSFYRKVVQGKWPYLQNSLGDEGSGKYVAFRADIFEKLFLKHFAEIDPRTILDGANGHKEVVQLKQAYQGLESKIEQGKLDYEQSPSSALAGLLARWETERDRLAKELAEARLRAAHPLSGAWSEAQSLLGVLEAAPDPQDARIRLRTALRQIVEGIWLLIVARGTARLAACQVWFKGGGQRSYIFLYCPPRHNNRSQSAPEYMDSRSFADAALPGSLDLRRHDHVRRLEKALLEVEIP
jgi:DNA invertase Pin-like site-specific DNA recombinase